MRKYATAAFGIITLASSAAVPLRWTVETSRLQPAVFDVVRGETLQLEAAFNSYGKPIQMTNETACVFWQTNGMGNAWWVGSAVAWSNLVGTAFLPSMDPGAATVSGFLGSSGSIYRAAFTLRFRHGPGAFPNVIDMPPKVLDLAHTVVVNPPWPTQADFAATTGVMRAELKAYVDDEIAGAGTVSPQGVTNIAESVTAAVVTKEYVEGLGIEAGTDGETVTNIVDGIVASSNLCTVAAAQAMTNDATIVRQDGSGAIIVDERSYPVGDWITMDTGYNTFLMTSYATDPDSSFAGTATKATKLYGNNGESVLSLSDGKWRSTGGIEDSLQWSSETAPIATNAAEAVVSNRIGNLNVGYTRLYNFVSGATNANFTATNYPPTAAAAAAKVHWEPEEGMDFSTVPASLQLNELRDGAWRTVMDTRDWTVWYYRFKEMQLTNRIAQLEAENDALSNRLETAQAWGNFTANGVENPMTDTTVVDRPNMWIMADYEWQKCVSGTNSCWVIRAKNAAISGGANTNGFLEICDAFGRPYMRVNKSAETFADCVFSNITYNADEGAWYVVFGNQAKPTKGGANCNLVGSSSGGGKCILYDEDLPECPATITWPETADSHAGHWIMKAVPKPVNGVVPSVMFFGAEIKVAGKDYVEYIKEASFGAGIRVGNNVYEAVESGNTLIWQKKVE